MRLYGPSTISSKTGRAVNTINWGGPVILPDPPNHRLYDAQRKFQENHSSSRPRKFQEKHRMLSRHPRHSQGSHKMNVSFSRCGGRRCGKNRHMPPVLSHLHFLDRCGEASACLLEKVDVSVHKRHEVLVGQSGAGNVVGASLKPSRGVEKRVRVSLKRVVHTQHTSKYDDTSCVQQCD